MWRLDQEQTLITRGKGTDKNLDLFIPFSIHQLFGTSITSTKVSLRPISKSAIIFQTYRLNEMIIRFFSRQKQGRRVG